MAAPSSRQSWIPVSVAWLGLIAALTMWLVFTPTGELREQLKVWQSWSLDLGVFAFFVSGVYLVTELRARFDRRDALRMALLAMVGLALTVFVAPRTSRIFYDEQIYQSVGQNLADLRRAQVCNDGVMDYGRLECWSGEYNKQPYGYPHLLGLMYRAFGTTVWGAFAVNAAAMAAIVFAVYMLTYLLFSNREAATLSGLLLALTPQQIIWSATAAVEPTASLALVAALLAAACFLRSGTTRALLATAVATAYALQFRPESLLVLPIVGLLVWPRLSEESLAPRSFWAGTVFLALAAVHVGHLVAIRNLEWGTTAARFSLQYFAGNLGVNGWFYVWDERFPVLITVLALLGLTASGFVRERAAMAGYFLVFFGIDLVFYAGSYNYGADVRYALLTFPSLAVLGGLGGARVVGMLSTWQPGIPVRALAIAVVVFQFLWYAPQVRATTEEAWAARADVRFARELAGDLPPNSYVLTHNPGMFHLWGVSAGQMSRAAGNAAYAGFLAERFTGGIYLHWNFWCNVQEERQPALCRQALTLAPADLVREYRERDQRFALYRLNVITH